MSPDPPPRWRRTRRKLRGLGDAVALVAQPIASAFDAILRTDIKHCTACESRKAAWNQRFPFPPLH